jgi:hypothetical protein
MFHISKYNQAESLRNWSFEFKLVICVNAIEGKKKERKKASSLLPFDFGYL